jgi:hypothetical protein
LCDDGTAQALAKVQAQYDDGTVVERIEREGTQSTYQIIKSGGAPGNFNPIVTYTTSPNGDKRLVSNPVLLECETCPTGYTKQVGGFVYKLVLNEAAVTTDLATEIVNDTAATSANVNDTGLRADGALDSKIVIVTLDVEVPMEDATVADLFTTIKAHADTAGAITAAEFELSFLGESSDVCVADADYDQAGAALTWTTGQTCDIFSKTIELDVDLDCGPFATPAAKTTASNAKLAELQAIYPDLSVTLNSTDIGDCRARFDGVLTSSPVCEDCETPEPIYPAMPDDYEFSAWSERTVGASEITSFSIAQGTLSVVAGDGGPLNAKTLTQGSSAAFFGTSGSGTGAVVKVELDAASNTVTSVALANGGTGYAVGDTITLRISLAPFGLSSTGDITLTVTGVGGQFPDDCECGIKFVAKNAFLCPPAMLADQIGTFTPKGVKIQVSGGEAPANLMEGYQFVTTPFKVTRHERDFDGTGWGINYMKQEKASAEYFAGISPRRSYAEGYLSGFETKLDPCTQYDKFTVKLRRNPYAGTASRRMGEEIRYVFLIPSNTGCSYESFVGALGGSVDCPKPADN